MSDALERVIAAQQAEIDRLHAMMESQSRYAISEAAIWDRVAAAAFAILHDPQSRECYRELMEAITARGYCRRCECLPCECQYEEGD